MGNSKKDRKGYSPSIQPKVKLTAKKLGETGKAAQFEIVVGGITRREWIPFSQIFEMHSNNMIVVTYWIAKEKGLI